MDDSYLTLCQSALWPATVVVCVTIFLALFRKQIGDRLARVVKVATPKGEVHFREQQDASGEAQGQLPKPSQRSLEDAVKSLLAEFPDQIFQAKENWDRLVQQASSWQFWWHCEYTYRLIYGSQIRILKHLEARGPLGAVAADLFPYYGSSIPQEWGYSFDHYIGFLVAQGLVEASSDQTYKLTQSGYDFLVYLRVRQYPEDKPF